jgi:hypothetical protein
MVCLAVETALDAEGVRRREGRIIMRLSLILTDSQDCFTFLFAGVKMH